SRRGNRRLFAAPRTCVVALVRVAGLMEFLRPEYRNGVPSDGGAAGHILWWNGYVDRLSDDTCLYMARCFLLCPQGGKRRRNGDTDEQAVVRLCRCLLSADRLRPARLGLLCARRPRHGQQLERTHRLVNGRQRGDRLYRIHPPVGIW